MELTYWRVIFDNGQEFFIKADVTSREQFLKRLTSRGSGLFTESGYISLKLTTESMPLDIKSSRIFSVQQINNGAIGSQTRVWSLE